jgi:hypothetical protein
MNRRHLVLSTALVGAVFFSSGAGAQSGAPELSVAESSAAVFRARLAFGSPILRSVSEGGRTWTRVESPGIDTYGGENGQPAVPIYRRFLAVPLGAEVAVEITRSSVRETHWVRLVPNQVFAGEISARDELWQAPFAYDRFAYARNTTFPPDICRVEIIGRVRDLRLAVLECAAGQYNPVT